MNLQIEQELTLTFKTKEREQQYTMLLLKVIWRLSGNLYEEKQIPTLPQQKDQLHF